jgi:hypothetical protein
MLLPCIIKGHAEGIGIYAKQNQTEGRILIINY